MARATVHIPDDLWERVKAYSYEKGNEVGFIPTFSSLVQESLTAYLEPTGRPEASERGRLATLRSLRAAREALDELERGLTSTKPVQRRVRRYTARSQGKRGT